jgi:hypothetical protein
MFELLAIGLLCVVYAKGMRALFAYRDREQKWRAADAEHRERMVREECSWRVIGRVAGASAVIVYAVFMAPPALAIMSVVAAWRVVKPIKQEMRDACFYRSTGTQEEPPYSF